MGLLRLTIPGAFTAVAGLENFDAEELTVVIAAAEKRRAAVIEDAKAKLQQEFAELARAMAWDVSDLAGRSKRGKRASAAAEGRTVVPIKYRGPNGETWTGRGRAPCWLAELEAKGKNRKSYAVD